MTFKKKIQPNLITKPASGALLSADMKHLLWSKLALFAEDATELDFVAVVFQSGGGEAPRPASSAQAAVCETHRFSLCSVYALKLCTEGGQPTPASSSGIWILVHSPVQDPPF